MVTNTVKLLAGLLFGEAIVNKDAFGYWFSGLVDGEGCFGIQVTKRQRLCSFQLYMRGDDAKIVQEIQHEFGIGHIYYQDRLQLGNNTYSGTGVNWQVKRAKDLHRVLVPALTKYPLRTRKLHEFEIWRQAVLILHNAYRCPRTVGTDNQLRQLRDQLHQLKTGTKTWRDGRLCEVNR